MSPHRDSGEPAARAGSSSPGDTQPSTDDMIQNENSRLFLGPANGSKEGTAPIVQRVGPADPSTDDPTLDWDKAMCKS
jgi:hypothetical protein